MRPTTAAVLALAALTSVASAQSVRVLVGSGPGPGTTDYLDTGMYVYPVNVSIFLDTEGQTEGAWADFGAWAALIGSIKISHAFGQPGTTIDVPTELAGQTAPNPNFAGGGQPDTWTSGRRPDALGVGGGSFGGWRFPDQGGFSVTDHGSGNLTLDANGAPINMGQQPAALGNAFPNQSEMIEIFRFRMTPSQAVGLSTITVDLDDVAFYYSDFNSNQSGLQSSMVVYPARAGWDIPTPSSLALLSIGALAARRRR